MNDTSNAVRRNTIFFTGYLILLLAGTVFLAQSGKRDSFLFFNSYHSPAADTFFTYYTNLGDGIFAIIVGLLYFFLPKKKKEGIALLVAYASSGIISVIIKNLITSPRPKVFFQPGEYKYFIEGVTHVGLSSMPSGHTTTAFAMATVLAMMSKNTLWQIPLLIAAAAEAFSRMYLGQHFLGDVIAGSLLGVLCGIATVHYTQNINPEKLHFKKKKADTIHTNLPSGNSNKPL